MQIVSSEGFLFWISWAIASCPNQRSITFLMRHRGRRCGLLVHDRGKKMPIPINGHIAGVQNWWTCLSSHSGSSRGPRGNENRRRRRQEVKLNLEVDGRDEIIGRLICLHRKNPADRPHFFSRRGGPDKFCDNEFLRFLVQSKLPTALCQPRQLFVN